MLKSEGSESKLKLWSGRSSIAVLCLLTALLVVPASAQVDFTLTADSFSPAAVAPEGTSSSNITIVTSAGFSGAVNLTCTVTPTVQIQSSSFPSCLMSPQSLTGSGGASATITTKKDTPEIGYTVTITGTDATGTQSSPPLGLTVLAVTQQFTIIVQTALSPTSVVAGTGAQAIVSVNPVNGYVTPSPNGYITLYCGTITPLEVLSPYCSFSYPPKQKGIQITGPTPVESTLTIATYGLVPTGSNRHPRDFYALWLSLPMLGLVGLSAAVGGKKSRKIWGLLALFVVCGAGLLLPACSNTYTQVPTAHPNGITPANTYTFSIIGVDTNGVVSSNTGSGTSTGSTVSLTVTAPPK